MDQARLAELESLAVDLDRSERVFWRCSWRLEKYEGDDRIAVPEPYEVIDGQGNLLMYGGASCLWECLIGNGTDTAAQTLTYFDNGHAYIGVGDSSTGEAATQTDLQAATNKLRKAVDATYPQHTDGAGASSNAQIVYKATFGTSDANWDWNEWGIFNGSAGGRMLNRKVVSLGTKTSAGAWAFTVTLSLA